MTGDRPQQLSAGGQRPRRRPLAERVSAGPAAARLARPTAGQIVEYLVRYARRTRGSASDVAAALLADYPGLREPLEDYDAITRRLQRLRTLLETAPTCRVGPGERCAAHDSAWPYSLLACEWEMRRRSALADERHD